MTNKQLKKALAQAERAKRDEERKEKKRRDEEIKKANQLKSGRVKGKESLSSFHTADQLRD